MRGEEGFNLFFEIKLKINSHVFELLGNITTFAALKKRVI